MQAVQRPVQMDLESPSHIPGPINGNPYATVNQAMKMKCRAVEEEDADYPGETKMAKYNGDSTHVFQFPKVMGENEMREEHRRDAMNELLDSLGMDPASVTSVRHTEKEVTMKISMGDQQKTKPPAPQRQSSFKATQRRLSGKGPKVAQPATTSPVPEVNNYERAKVQTAPPDGDPNVYYASHYAASQPGKVKAKLYLDSQSAGQISPTASPELIANRKLLLDVIGGEEDSDEEDQEPGASEQRPNGRAHESDSESESEEETFHESPTLPRRGNVASKVEFLSKSIAFSPQSPESPELQKCKGTKVPMIGLTQLAPTEVSDRIAKHNEKSLAAGQVLATANMVLYSSKNGPRKVVDYDPTAHHSDDEERDEEDFRTAVTLRHHDEEKLHDVEILVTPALRNTDQGWNKVEENESDHGGMMEPEHAELEEFPPPPPPITQDAAEVKTIKMGEPLKFKLNLHVSDDEKLVVSPTIDEGHTDSGLDDSATSTPITPYHGEIKEPAIQKLAVHQEESVSQELFDELFAGNDDRQADSTVTTPQKVALAPVSVVIETPESQAKQHAAEDEAFGYSRIEDITPGKGKQDSEMRDIKENGMTDEEFLNSYRIIPERSTPVKSEPAKVEPEKVSPSKPKLSPAERAPAVLNELINGIRTMKQEMSHKAKESPENMDTDVFPASPTSDHSSPTLPLSPTSTLSSRGKRRRRRASDKGYSSNSSLSETEFFVEIPKNPSVKFDKDTSAYWYKPHITREQAIALLQDKSPGTFVIRDSQSYTGAFGLAIKVEVPPMHVIQNQQTKDFEHIDPSEFVRHLLIESTPKGVHLKDCKDEPLFGSLAAFVYQHSLTEISLPCKLILPTKDLTVGTLKITDRQETESQLLSQGAACNVAYLGTFNVESLTGPAAFQYAVAKIEPGRKNKEHEPVLVNFKVNKQGITITDNERKLFFRKHYPLKYILYWGTDPDDTRWDLTEYGGGNMARSFIFVSRKPDSDGNECHLFGEMDPKQPASTVVDVITKIISNVNS